ncbi:MAG: acyl-CoA thioesterase [Chloroflexota bacterium]|nr:acyl-CoA thioesterase [Chloroflexota bacterium]
MPAGQDARGEEHGGDDGFRFKTDVQVRFRDLDPMDHVNNAVYFTYFEIARLAYWAALTGSSDLRDRGMIVAEATCTYRSPALYDERLEVWIRVAALRRSSFVYEYRITAREDGRPVATGRTVMVMYDYGAGRSVPIPPDLRARFEAFEGRPLSEG